MYNHDVFKAASEGKATHREPLAKFGLWFLGYTSGQTNRNTHHNTQFPFSSGVTNDRYECGGPEGMIHQETTGTGRSAV